MTCIKKIDWLRHLYYEATKWRNSLTGQVKWGQLKVKDPHNGAKMAVHDLETDLPKMLQDCLNKNQVPLEYQPEVNHFMSTVSMLKQFDNKFVANLVCIRRLAIGLIETLERFSKLSPADKVKVRSKIKNEDLQSVHRVVCDLQTICKGMGLEEGHGRVEADEPEQSSKFKRNDWLRHMYVMCQKRLNHQQGQLQWKKLKAQDPNNSKDGKRMKMEEVKQSLKILVPSLDDSIVPRAYQFEVDQIRNILCRGEGHFCNDVLEHAEKLRKVSLRLVEFLLPLKDNMQEVVSAIEKRKLSWMWTVLVCLQEQLKTTGELETNNLEVVEVAPDLLENIIPDLPYNHMNQPRSAELESGHQNVDINDVESNEVPEFPSDEGTSDGTEYLMDIINTYHQEESKPGHVNDEMSGHIGSPASSLSDSEVFSEVSSPASLHPHHLRDDFLSDDSGIYSPEAGNPLDLDPEDAFELEDTDTSIFDIELLSSLNVMVLPESNVSSLENHGSPNRKRKSSCESIEEKAIKKAKP